ncbi:uncharacterized protein LOC144629260 [Oculina patagonica]
MERQDKGDSKPKKNKDEPKIKESDAQKANDVLSLEELTKENSELKNKNKALEKTIQQQKSKINDLRVKTWKAGDDLVRVERKASRTSSTQLRNKKVAKIVITERELHLACELEESKKQITALKTLDRQKDEIINRHNKKNNELRTKLWRKSDALHQSLKDLKMANSNNEELARQLMNANDNLKMANSNNEELASELETTKTALEVEKNTSFLQKRFKEIYDHLTFRNIVYSFLTLQY